MRGKSYDDGWLTAYWSKREKDILFGSPCKTDGHLLYGAISYLDVGLGRNLVQELESRGYDITTLQFSIKRKWKPNESPAQPAAEPAKQGQQAGA